MQQQHPDAKCQLDYGTPFELLVAVILSAQCTDKRVNEVTPKLFAFCNTPERMATLAVDELIPYIRSCGFFNNKAHNLIACAKAICNTYHGQVPSTVEELVTLPGVGRKTANVVYSVAFGGNAIPVDTHVFRLAHRLGLSQGKTPDAVEQDLCRQFDEQDWSLLHHLLILHGRTVCMARKPHCADCNVCALCPSAGQCKTDGNIGE